MTEVSGTYRREQILEGSNTPVEPGPTIDVVRVTNETDRERSEADRWMAELDRTPIESGWVVP